LLTNYQHDLTPHLKEMTLLTAGYVAVDFTSLMKEAALKCVQRVTTAMTEEQKEKIITIEDVRAAVKEVQPVLKKDGFAKIPTVKLE
jgi:SpoVK/Ycf46/Vps4 family AAA+-type ATPase